ncbi:MAG: hypothetical protein QXJ17_06575 [Nitrososphaeria archaeon]
MEPIDLILSIVYYAGEVDGRTRLQKIAYFVCEKLGLNLGFMPHYYGPYSSVVAKTLDDLVATDFIEEDAIPTSSGRILFVYKLKSDVKGDFGRKGEIKNLIEKLAKEDLSRLIAASKVHYLFNKYKGIGSLPDAARKHGWVIGDNTVKESLVLLNELGLKVE